MVMEAREGDICLCQGGGGASCAACCGLYNIADPSFERLSGILAQRAGEFSQTSRGRAGIARYTQRVQDRERQEDKPYEVFLHCPFLAFIAQERVGCLLHPLVEGNKGRDLRAWSLYGGDACRLYTCPTHLALEPRHKKLLMAAAPDWYAYGLLVPETGLLQNFFGQVEALLGQPLDPEKAATSPDCRQAMARLFRLKTSWPFGPEGLTSPGPSFFSGFPCRPPSIDYAALGVSPSPQDPIFRALGSCFADAGAIGEAEAAIRSLVLELAHALAHA